VGRDYLELNKINDYKSSSVVYMYIYDMRFSSLNSTSYYEGCFILLIMERKVYKLWFYLCLLVNRLGDGSVAPSPGGLDLDGSLVPLGSTAAHEPMVMPRDLWARRKSLDETMNSYKMIGMNI